MTSQKLNLGNYGITLHTQEEQDEKSPLVKKWVCWCCWCKMAGIYNNSYALMTPYKSFQHRLGWKFYKDLYEVIRAQRCLYLPTNLYYQADLCKRTFSSCSFWICQPFPFVTSGFFSLFRQHSTSLTFNLEMAINMN